MPMGRRLRGLVADAAAVTSWGVGVVMTENSKKKCLFLLTVLR